MKPAQLNLLYETLLKAVGVMPSVAETIHKDRDAMTGFVGYLNQNEAEIFKFGKATDEVCDYLNKYDFVKGCQFESMQKIIGAFTSFATDVGENGQRGLF